MTTRFGLSFAALALLVAACADSNAGDGLTSAPNNATPHEPSADTVVSTAGAPFCASHSGHAACNDFDDSADGGPALAPLTAGGYAVGGACSISEAKALSGTHALACKDADIEYIEQGASGKLAFDAFIDSTASDTSHLARSTQWDVASLELSDGSNPGPQVSFQVTFDAKTPAGRIDVVRSDAVSAGPHVADYVATTFATPLVAGTSWHRFELAATTDKDGTIHLQAAADGTVFYDGTFDQKYPGVTEIVDSFGGNQDGVGAEVQTKVYLDNVTVD